ncbi:uncharacterized protein [Asterias amurensis]|uniref:uncharacterized protein n=1 Tax=Asterias amurensis TaxID=7602 RepID=UPI003AB34B38
MAKLSYTALLVCTLALVQIVNGSSYSYPCNREIPFLCCDGKEGSTRAPAAWPDSQSPAGGPSRPENSGAVVCVLYRESDCLTCRFSSIVSKCCIAGNNETDDRDFGGPTPLNEYLIGKGYIHPTQNTHWYNLYPRHESQSTPTYYGNDEPTATGRSGLALHSGTRRCEGPLEGADCWVETMAVLDMGNMIYTGSTTRSYSGFLYVLDE